MDAKTSALHSEYIIDGIAQDLTPAQMLDACLPQGGTSEPQAFAPVVDETIDPALKPCITDPSLLETYLRQVRALKSREFPSSYPETYTKFRVATALLDAIWRRGHFRLGDLSLSLDWSWTPRRIGDMATFYASAQAAADYVDSLGLKLSSYSCAEDAGECSLKVCSALAAPQPDEGVEEDTDFFGELPWGTEHPVMRAQNAHPSRLLPDAQSWLIYVPFENCEYRLGASCMAQVLGVSGVVAPQIVDPDYFIDCYEVVRELVEDGVVLSGVTVGDGGLLPALRRMCSPRLGCTVDLSALKGATGESDIVRLLFSEVPGVLFQISDIDYDYVDAELLLQDVAFYPLGHPTPDEPGVRVSSADRSGIQTILESLIRSQSSEGED